jgi:hypothetical protein
MKKRVKKMNFKKKLMFLIVIGILVVLTGCGGDSNTSDILGITTDNTGNNVSTTVNVASSGSYTIVDTSQSLNYATATGDDAYYEGNDQNLTDNGDGTVIDNNTGLMWQKTPEGKMSYSEAVAKVGTVNTGGHTDWRLPTIKELYSLMRFD